MSDQTQIIISEIVSLSQILLQNTEAGFKALKQGNLPEHLKKAIFAAFGDRNNEEAITLLLKSDDEDVLMAAGILNWIKKHQKRSGK